MHTNTTKFYHLQNQKQNDSQPIKMRHVQHKTSPITLLLLPTCPQITIFRHRFTASRHKHRHFVTLTLKNNSNNNNNRSQSKKPSFLLNPNDHPLIDPSNPIKMSSYLFIALLIILWYSSNIGVLLLNKLLLSNYGFKFPIFLTMCHMSACAILSYVSIVFLKVVPLQKIKSRSQLLRIACLSVVFCGSVVGGNISLRYLPVSFNQAVGATTPFFTALFAYLVTLKREAWITYGALVPVVTGVIIASGGEPSFHLYGFIMCISATAARAFKSVLQGILLSSEGEKLNSMNLLLYMSPIAIAVLLPAALVMEPDVIDVTLSLTLNHKFMWLLLLVNSTMAYAANLTNFLVTKNTSALTLQVLGNAKGAVAVVISILLFRNPVTFVGIAGYSMTVMGVVAYGEAKRRYQ